MAYTQAELATARQQPGGESSESGYGGGGGPQRAPLHQTPKDALMEAIKAYYEYMNMDIDKLIEMGDPGAMGIQNAAYNNADRAARNRGIDGPLSVLNTQQTTANALSGYEMQRKGLGLQALGLANNRDTAMQEMARLSQTDARNREDAMNAGRYQESTNWGSAIGGVLGGLGGAIASIPSFGTMAPVLIPAGIGAGAGLGGAIGGAAAGGAPRPSTATGSRAGGYSGW